MEVGRKCESNIQRDTDRPWNILKPHNLFMRHENNLNINYQLVILVVEIERYFDTNTRILNYFSLEQPKVQIINTPMYHAMDIYELNAVICITKINHSGYITLDRVT